MELQINSGLLFSLCSSNCREYKIDILLGFCFVCYDAVVIDITDDGEIQCTLSGLNVRNIRYPLLIRSICFEIPVQQIGITMQILSLITVFFSSNHRKKDILLHNSQYCFGAVMESFHIVKDIRPKLTLTILTASINTS